MTVQNLCIWVTRAQDIREKSWGSRAPRQYNVSFEQALNEAMFVEPTNKEREMALFLMFNAWNEVQEWAKD